MTSSCHLSTDTVLDFSLISLNLVTAITQMNIVYRDKLTLPGIMMWGAIGYDFSTNLVVI